MGKQYRNLWSVVKRIILDNYEVLIKHRIREGFYLIGDMLAPLIGSEITQEEYDYFTVNKQGASSYRDDIWPSLEQKHGLVRPRAKPYGVVYDRGKKYEIERLGEVWEQARGFIFTETLEDGEDLQVLSEYGWTIIAGGGMAGFPTRQIRQLLKKDYRPVLVFHDSDISGRGIYRALGFETRRTSHLDIALGDRVTDLGLTEEDAKKLGLRSRPEPPKYKGVPRFETSALILLEKRMGIENPKLAYVVAKMIVLGVTLSPTEKSKEKLLSLWLRIKIKDALRNLISNAVDDAMEELKPEGEAVSLEIPDLEDIAMEELEDMARDLALELGKQVKWFYERDYHDEAVELTMAELVELLG